MVKQAGITGTAAMVQDLSRLPVAIDEELVEAVDIAVTGEMDRLRRKIPRDTGELAASLTQINHPDHYSQPAGSKVEVGTRLEYAKYQAKRLPRPNPQVVVEAVAQNIFMRLQGGGQ